MFSLFFLSFSLQKQGRGCGENVKSLFSYVSYFPFFSLMKMTGCQLETLIIEDLMEALFRYFNKWFDVRFSIKIEEV